jgi:hypothetical protein
MCSCPERVVWNTGYPFGIHAPTSFNSSGALAGWVSLLNGCADYLNGWLNTMWAGQRANPEHRPGSAGLVGNNQGSQQTVRFSWRGTRSLGVRNGSSSGPPSRVPMRFGDRWLSRIEPAWSPANNAYGFRTTVSAHALCDLGREATGSHRSPARGCDPDE